MKDLYQEIIVRHHKAPVGEGEPANWTHRSEGRNARCGDELTLYLRIEDGCVAGGGFEAQACAVTRAASSLLLEAVRGLRVEEAEQLGKRVCGAVEQGEEAEELSFEEWGELAALNALRAHPGRRDCGLLPFRTLCRALAAQRSPR